MKGSNTPDKPGNMRLLTMRKKEGEIRLVRKIERHKNG